MHRSSPHPQSSVGRAPRRLTALALAAALAHLSPPVVPGALAHHLEAAAPPAAPAAPAAPAGPRRAAERYAPAFRLETLDGDHISLADLRGKITLLDFWATWCAPCVASVPSLKKIAAQMAGQPFTLISVSGDRNGARVRDFVASHAPTWPQCWDGNGTVQGQLGIRELPTFVLIDADGRILFSKAGWGRRVEGELLAEIHRAVQALAAAAGKSLA
jgi:thiol-disulfide isomerase/thioredoxin